MYTGNPGHLQSFNYLGFHRYSLTLCTYQRQPLFVREPVVALVLLQISRAAVEQRFAVIAYGFMPDHLHLLVEGQTEASDGKRLITRAKQYSGHDYSKQFQRRLWQRLWDTVAPRAVLHNPGTDAQSEGACLQSQTSPRFAISAMCSPARYPSA